MSKPHDDAAKRQARQVYEARGAKAAGQVTGIAVRTIQRWAQTYSGSRVRATAPRPCSPSGCWRGVPGCHRNGRFSFSLLPLRRFHLQMWPEPEGQIESLGCTAFALSPGSANLCKAGHAR
jgi:hypothetical protein